MNKLFSDNPAELKAMADESIERLKVELAEFDARMAQPYERLIGRVQAAREDQDSEAYDDYSREAGRYLARWQDNRRPYIQQIQQIAMARDELEPRALTLAWTQAVFGDIPQL